jgi:RimJ/RimL family protein N-acetyltransferase
MNGFKLEPVTLTGRHVTLEPLTTAHVPELREAVDFPEIWRFMPFQPSSEAQLGALVEQAVGLEASGQMLTFAQRSNAEGRVVGSTSYLNPDPTNRRVEIGATEEGTLRHHMIMPDRHLRDSVYFSILRTEWPEVRASLEGLMSNA